MALVGSLFFCHISDDFLGFFERLESYFKENDITADNHKTALLIQAISDEKYRTLRDLCYPQLPSGKPYGELIELMKLQYSIAGPSVYRERIKFYDAEQGCSETISEWYGRIKQLSIDCQFGEQLNAILLDRFTSGLSNPLILDRLCQEEDEYMTIAKAVQIASCRERALATNQAQH